MLADAPNRTDEYQAPFTNIFTADRVRKRVGNLRRMPRVPNQWLDAIVYIYPTATEAVSGERGGATGFLASVPRKDPQIPEGLCHHYVVTNHHTAVRHSSLALRLNNRSGGFDVLTVRADDWFSHPSGDDIAVLPFSGDWANFQYAAVNSSMMLTPDLSATWDIGPGDETFFIGRYVDMDGKAHNMPVVRSGILAAFPAEPVYQRERSFHQESILVEARSMSGFSGSPVFVTPAGHVERSNEFGGAPAVRHISHGPCFFLGVDWGHQPWKERVRDENGDLSSDHRWVAGNSGMMLVVPAQKLISLLAHEDLVDQREKVERHERGLRGLAEPPTKS
jgi:hypothetical protein